MKLEGKVAIISGAGRGIGRATALRLAEEGADIVVNSYSEDTTASTADEVKARGRRALAIPGDITKADKVLEVINTAIDTFGKIDIVVCNVGGGGSKTPKKPQPGPLGRVIVQWEAAYEQNIQSTVYLCEGLAPHFIEQKSGKIVNFSSGAGRFSPSYKSITNFVSPAYCAMKAGVISYTKTLAQRLGPHSINVNCICPGIVYTESWVGGTQYFVTNFDEFKGLEPMEWFEGIAKGEHPSWFNAHPLRRAATKEDCAATIAFLVSEDAKNVTGQVINVDSGYINMVTN